MSQPPSAQFGAPVEAPSSPTDPLKPMTELDAVRMLCDLKRWAASWLDEEISETDPNRAEIERFISSASHDASMLDNFMKADPRTLNESDFDQAFESMNRTDEMRATFKRLSKAVDDAKYCKRHIDRISSAPSSKKARTNHEDR